MRKRNGFAGTGAAKHVSAVAAVVLTVGKGELFTATHTDV